MTNDQDITLNVPNHIGIILDGNRRWAKSKGLPTFEGHRAGYDNLKKIVRHANKLGVKTVSAFSFSTENWKRSKEEVKYLMGLALRMATKDVGELNKDGFKVLFLGRRDGLSKQLVKAIDNAESLTKDNTNGTLAICFNYGGALEIVDAVKQIMSQGVSAEDVDEELIAKNLYAPEVGPVDLLIRTSGEMRLSNFMLWRAAYSELYFTEKLWPDFGESDLEEAIAEYNKRHRRFGGN